MYAIMPWCPCMCAVSRHITLIAHRITDALLHNTIHYLLWVRRYHQILSTFAISIKQKKVNTFGVTNCLQLIFSACSNINSALSSKSSFFSANLDIKSMSSVFYSKHKNLLFDLLLLMILDVQTCWLQSPQAQLVRAVLCRSHCPWCRRWSCSLACQNQPVGSVK